MDKQVSCYWPCPTWDTHQESDKPAQPEAVLDRQWGAYSWNIYSVEEERQQIGRPKSETGGQGYVYWAVSFQTHTADELPWPDEE